MDLLVVNSNTSAGITELVRQGACAAAAPATRITALTAPYGPAAIECPEDAAIAAGATREAVLSFQGSVDAAIIACFSDPGLQALRSEAAFPVVGIAEAAMITASMMGAHFSILTVAPSTIAGIEGLAREYGVQDQLAGVHALQRGVLESHGDPAGTARALAQLAALVLEREAPDVLVLGGAVTATLATDLARLVPVPVLEGVRCAVAQAELLVSMRRAPG